MQDAPIGAHSVRPSQGKGHGGARRGAGGVYLEKGARQQAAEGQTQHQDGQFGCCFA